jgi:Domain of unknown function (DUF4173)
MRTLLYAFLLGLAADLLLRYVPWGANAPMWVVLFLVAAIVLVRAHRRPVVTAMIFPAIGALVAAAGIVWRDSDTLFALDVLMLMVFLPMLAVGSRGIRLRATGLLPLAYGMLVTAAQMVIGPFQLLLEDIEWRALPGGSIHRRAGVLIRGVLIALPVLLLFGMLLSQADPAFANLLGGIFRFELTDAVAHVVVTAFVAVVCAGFFRSLTGGAEATVPSRPASLKLGAGEINVALTLVNLLFAMFVFVQLRYLFGGSQYVRVGKLTWSEYARRGFFELVWVVALVLPLLLLAEWLVDKEKLRTFRLLALAQVALVSVIAASAYRRMQLYRDEFGLTELRYYTTAFMIWLAALLLWFVVTVLTGRRERFAIGVLATAVLTIAILHAMNPDQHIVTTNAARAREGVRPFDANYTLQLSDDATDALMRNLDLMPPCTVRMFAAKQRTIGWRTWNASRADAIEALRDRRAEVERISRRCVRSRVEGHATDRPARP